MLRCSYVAPSCVSSLLSPPNPTEEFNVYNVGLVPSMFYKVIDSKDLDGFKNTLWTAALAVSAVAIVSVCLYYVCSSVCACIVLFNACIFIMCALVYVPVLCCLMYVPLLRVLLCVYL